jgi:hypothetical protein
LDSTGRIVADYGDQRFSRSWRYVRVPANATGRRALLQQSSFDVVHGDLAATAFTTHGTDLYVTHGERFEVLVFDASAALRRIVRKQHASYAVPSGWGDSVWGLRRPPPDPEIAWFSEVERPPDAPQAAVTDRIILDRAGNLWVRGMKLGDPAPPTWFVFDSAGVLRQSLRSALDIRRIDDDRVIAVMRDSLGVERVGVFGLRKGR